MSRFVANISDFLVSPESLIRDAIARMDEAAQGILLVADFEGSLIGTITDGDLRRAMMAGTDIARPVSELLKQKSHMDRDVPITAPADSPDSELLHMMVTLRLRHIPLLDNDKQPIDIALLSELAQEYEPNFQAVVMAGGLGTRLRPLTENTPKPMLHVGGRPLMERTIEKLKKAGVGRVNITTHYRPEKIVEHFGLGDELGVDLNYVNEDEPLGTAGALDLLDAWDETLLLINGDILTNVDFTAMLDYHRSHEAELTVAVRRYDVQVPYGVVECDGVNISAIKEKPELRFFVNAGIYLLEPSLRHHIPKKTKFDMTDLIESLIDDKANVVSFPIREYWLDIGQQEDYAQAQQDIESGRFVT
jgi:dTDP-glucose pyrophosphorylase/CBS domain-containing protein